MNINKVGNRGVVFTFEDDALVYLINADNKIFLCDTHLGPKSMESIKKYIDDHQLSQKEIIIFNSHADWDHIWGNCAFEDATIVGHEECKKRMQERGEFDLELLSKYHNGNIELKLPNLTFSSRLKFEEDEIEFIYAPGHTICSSICIDKKDSVAYVGDLLEYPIPFLNHYDLKPFVKTLEYIKSLSVNTIVTTHSGIVDENLIDENMEYVKNVYLKNPVNLKDEMSQQVYNVSMKNILVLKYEDIIRKKLAAKFDFKTYKREFWSFLNSKYGNLDCEYWNIRNIKYEDLEETFESYIASL